MKIQSHSLAAIAALCISTEASAYQVGFGFGRPLLVRSVNSRNLCGNGACNDSSADDPFDTLRSEFGRGRRRRRRFVEPTPASVDRQREMIKQAFNLATEFMDDSVGTTGSVGKTSEFVDRAFGIVDDLSTGRTSPRYEVSQEDDAFLLAIDVPGIRAEDLDLSVNEDEFTLTIAGKRTIGRGDAARVSEFSKTFTLDSSALLDSISAKLNNGVLAVTVPKEQPKPKEEIVRKVPIEVSLGEDDGDYVADGEIESGDTISDAPQAIDISENNDNEESKEGEEKPTSK